MSVKTSEKLVRFMADYNFNSWSLEDGELVFYTASGEPFNAREFKPGTRIRMDWKKLEDEMRNFGRNDG